MMSFCDWLLCVGEKLWWADQGTDQIGTCDKRDGGNWKVLRNSTSAMMHLKIYNETVQKGVCVCLCVRVYIMFGQHGSYRLEITILIYVSMFVCVFVCCVSRHQSVQ